MSPWREEWLHHGAAGARSGHHYQSIAWELNMEIEHSQITGTSLSGCTADRKKFFDLLEHDIGNRLMQALGCPAGVLAAEK
eukprot:4671802-Pyramimonas_sp.AAC.1